MGARRIAAGGLVIAFVCTGGGVLITGSAAAAPVPDGGYVIGRVGSNQVVDVPGATPTTGRQLITWAKSGAVNQKWTLAANADGTYSVRSLSSGLCMDVSGGQTTAGATVIQWTCTGGSNQKWLPTNASSTGYTLRAKHSGLVLTASNTSSGAVLTQQADTGAATQQWTFTATTGSTVVDVSSFGADPTGAADSAPAVKAAFRYAKALGVPVTIRFPQGTYQLYPESAEVRELYVSNTVGADQAYRDKRIGLLVEDMRDVTVDGQGSKLNFHGLQTAFAAIRSTNVTFTNLTVDYVAPKVIDAKVSETGVANGRGFRVLTIPPGSPYRVANNQITWLGETSPTTGTPYWSGVNGLQYTQVHDPAQGRTWRAGNPLFSGIASISDLGAGRIRLEYTSSTQPGDRGLVYQMRQINRDQPGAFIWESTNVALRSMTARHLQTFGLVAQFSQDLTIDDVDFAPDPASGRSTAGFADFVQVSGMKGTVSITNSTFDGAHDDPINIHGTYLEVTGKPTANSVTLAYRHPQTAGFPQFYVGNTLEFVAKSSMAAVGQAVVTAVDGPSGQDHTKSLTTMTITLDRPVPAEVTIGSTVAENTTYTPTVRIADNVFRNIPTRGILVTTRKPVVIENNVFDGMSMASIYISSDASSWYESGPVTDVVIRGNTFSRPANPAVFVEPTNSTLDSTKPVHRNITIDRNTFDIGTVNLVDAKSVGGLTISNNTVRRLDRASLVRVRPQSLCPPVSQSVQLSAAAGVAQYGTPLYVLRGSSDVSIEGNGYDNGLNARANTVSTPTSEITVTNDATKVDTDNRLPLLGQISYSSDNPAVVEIQGSTAIARAAGQARITAITTTGAGPATSTPVTMTVGGDASSPQCTQPPTLSPELTIVRDNPAKRSIDSPRLGLTPSGAGFLWAGTNKADNIVLSGQGSGSGTATVKMTGRTTRGYMEAGLILYTSDDDYVAIQRKHNNGTPTLTVVSERTGAAEESRTIGDPIQQDVWLRLSRSGTTVTASYSLDGATFTQIGTAVTIDTLSNARFGVLAEVESPSGSDSPFWFSSLLVNGQAVPFVW